MMSGYRGGREEEKRCVLEAFVQHSTGQRLSSCCPFVEKRFTECSLSLFLSLSLCVPHTHLALSPNWWSGKQREVSGRVESGTRQMLTSLTTGVWGIKAGRGRDYNVFCFFSSFHFYSYRAGWVNSYSQSRTATSLQSRWFILEQDQLDNVWQQSRSLWDESRLKAVTGDFGYSAAIVVRKHMSLHTMTKWK